MKIMPPIKSTKNVTIDSWELFDELKQELSLGWKTVPHSSQADQFNADQLESAIQEFVSAPSRENLQLLPKRAETSPPESNPKNEEAFDWLSADHLKTESPTLREASFSNLTEEPTLPLPKEKTPSLENEASEEKEVRTAVYYSIELPETSISNEVAPVSSPSETWEIFNTVPDSLPKNPTQQDSSALVQLATPTESTSNISSDQCLSDILEWEIFEETLRFPFQRRMFSPTTVSNSQWEIFEMHLKERTSTLSQELPDVQHATWTLFAKHLLRPFQRVHTSTDDQEGWEVFVFPEQVHTKANNTNPAILFPSNLHSSISEITLLENRMRMISQTTENAVLLEMSLRLSSILQTLNQDLVNQDSLSHLLPVFIIRSQGTTLALSSASVVEHFQWQEDQMAGQIFWHQEYILYQNRQIPLIKLSELLHLSEVSSFFPTQPQSVVVESTSVEILICSQDHCQFALLVDRIVGQNEAQLHSLEMRGTIFNGKVKVEDQNLYLLDGLGMLEAMGRLESVDSRAGFAESSAETGAYLLCQWKESTIALPLSAIKQIQQKRQATSLADSTVFYQNKAIRCFSCNPAEQRLEYLEEGEVHIVVCQGSAGFFGIAVESITDTVHCSSVGSHQWFERILIDQKQVWVVNLSQIDPQ